MKVYASIDRIEENEFAVCEVEKIKFVLSKPEDFATKEYDWIDVPIEMFKKINSNVSEGEIYIVEYDDKMVKEVYTLAIEEMRRRESL